MLQTSSLVSISFFLSNALQYWQRHKLTGLFFFPFTISNKTESEIVWNTFDEDKLTSDKSKSPELQCLYKASVLENLAF